LNLLEECTLVRLKPEFDLKAFKCIEQDLTEFLKNDALNYTNELMGVTYLFTLDKEPETIVCFFTVSNDVLNLQDVPKKNKINRPIPNSKRSLEHYPSVKIGRLGIDCKFSGLEIGDQLMHFIKDWFLYQNKTGCRFIIVDAYNKEKVLKYYNENSFGFLFETEQEEHDYTFEEEEDSFSFFGSFKLNFKNFLLKKPESLNLKSLKTRFMYFDLKSKPKSK
jgi:hypothetical protein